MIIFTRTDAKRWGHHIGGMTPRRWASDVARSKSIRRSSQAINAATRDPRFLTSEITSPPSVSIELEGLYEGSRIGRRVLELTRSPTRTPDHVCSPSAFPATSRTTRRSATPRRTRRRRPLSRTPLPWPRAEAVHIRDIARRSYHREDGVIFFPWGLNSPSETQDIHPTPRLELGSSSRDE